MQRLGRTGRQKEGTAYLLLTAEELREGIARLGIHASDTGVYDRDGRPDEQFIEWYSKQDEGKDWRRRYDQSLQPAVDPRAAGRGRGTCPACVRARDDRACGTCPHPGERPNPK